MTFGILRRGHLLVLTVVRLFMSQNYFRIFPSTNFEVVIFKFLKDVSIDKYPKAAGIGYKNC
jgi:hypothetical protein